MQQRDTRVCPNSGVMMESMGRSYLSYSTHPTKNKLLWFLALETKQEAKHLVGLLFAFGKMCSSYMGILLVPIHKPTWKKFIFVTRAEIVGYIWTAKTGGSINAYLTDHQLKPSMPRLMWAFLIGNISHMLTHIVVGRIKRIYTTLWDRTPESLCLISPGLHPGTFSPLMILNYIILL